MHIEPIGDEQEDLGNVRPALILGTISLAFSLFPFLLFIGMFISLCTGLLTLLLCSRDTHFYKAYPGRFTSSSRKRSKKAHLRATAGLVITVIWIIIWAVNYGKDGLN